MTSGTSTTFDTNHGLADAALIAVPVFQAICGYEMLMHSLNASFQLIKEMPAAKRTYFSAE